MSSANTSSLLIRDSINLCVGVIEMLSVSQTKMQNKYKNAGNEWSDSKYQQLGEIVNNCCSSIKKTLNELNGCLVSLNEIEKIVMEYESISLAGGSYSNVTREGSGRNAGYLENPQSSFAGINSNSGSYSREKTGAIRTLVATLTSVVATLMPFLIRLNVDNNITVQEAYTIRRINEGQGDVWPWVERVQIREDESDISSD